MKTQAKTRFAVAALVAGAVALPATGAMAASKTERALLGGLLGAIAGAALSDGDGGAVALGAVAGAALGSATAKDNNRRYNASYRQTQSYYGDNRYNGYSASNGYDRGYYDQSRNSRTDRYDRTNRSDRQDRRDPSNHYSSNYSYGR